MQKKRSAGQRRWGLEDQFPVRDSEGFIVVTERRQLTDRRLDNTSLADRLMMFSEMPVVDLERVDDD
jgi:hypothetical protein